MPSRYVSIFSTVNRFPGLFRNHPYVDYNSETTFARVLHGKEHTFVSECKRHGIQFLSYPPGFSV